MNIGFFTDTYFPQINGVSYTVQLWKRELEKQGHEVFVYYPEGDYKPGKNEVPMPSMPLIFYKGYKIGVPDKSMPKHLDIVHLHSLFSIAAYGLGVARKRKIPCILTYHTPVDMYVRHVSSNEYVQESLKTLYKIWETELFERCTLITVPSVVIRDLLKEEVEAHIGSANQFDGTILIGGDGPVRKDYEKMANGRDNVRFLGFLPRDRLCEFYSALDVLVLPSTAETEGLVVLEANACGTPVVGADALALKETIVEGINGYKYKSGDKGDLLSKLESVYGEKEKLKKSSKKHAKEHSVENTTKRLVSIYGKLKK
jgi:1,2-diacylglycerol 3-alpha-glucosyltransferase